MIRRTVKKLAAVGLSILMLSTFMVGCGAKDNSGNVASSSSELKEVKLVDYKVRVLDSESTTGAKVRVLIESTDSNESWSTVGVSKDVIQASWIALVDSIEYKLIKDIERKAKAYF